MESTEAQILAKNAIFDDFEIFAQFGESLGSLGVRKSQFLRFLKILDFFENFGKLVKSQGKVVKSQGKVLKSQGKMVESPGKVVFH